MTGAVCAVHTLCTKFPSVGVVWAVCMSLLLCIVRHVILYCVQALATSSAFCYRIGIHQPTVYHMQCTGGVVLAAVIKLPQECRDFCALEYLEPEGKLITCHCPPPPPPHPPPFWRTLRNGLHCVQLWAHLSRFWGIAQTVRTLKPNQVSDGTTQRISVLQSVTRRTREKTPHHLFAVLVSSTFFLWPCVALYEHMMQTAVWGYGYSSAAVISQQAEQNDVYQGAKNTATVSFSSVAGHMNLTPSTLTTTPSTLTTTPISYSQQNATAYSVPGQSTVSITTAATSDGNNPPVTHKSSTTLVASMATYNPDQNKASDPPSVSNHYVRMEGPFASGGVCDAYRLWFVESDGKQGPLHVAKKYKFGNGVEGFKEDYQASFAARATAATFNAELQQNSPGTPEVSCLTVNRLLQLQGDTHYYCVEEFIEGDFCKYNNIFGDVEPPVGSRTALHCEIANAFSHFSFVRFKCQFAILDVQGVGTSWTDVAIVSKEPSQYGYTDTGPSGLKAFFDNHICGQICRDLGLTPINSRSAIFTHMISSPSTQLSFPVPPSPGATSPTRPSKPYPSSLPPTPTRSSSATYTPGALQVPKPVSELQPTTSGQPGLSQWRWGPHTLWKAPTADTTDGPRVRRTLTPTGQPAAGGSKSWAASATYSPDHVIARRKSSTAAPSSWQTHTSMTLSSITLPQRTTTTTTASSLWTAPSSIAATSARAAPAPDPAPAPVPNGVPTPTPPTTPAFSLPKASTPTLVGHRSSFSATHSPLATPQRDDAEGESATPAARVSRSYEPLSWTVAKPVVSDTPAPTPALFPATVSSAVPQMSTSAAAAAAPQTSAGYAATGQSALGSAGGRPSEASSVAPRPYAVPLPSEYATAGRAIPYLPQSGQYQSPTTAVSVDGVAVPLNNVDGYSGAGTTAPYVNYSSSPRVPAYSAGGVYAGAEQKAFHIPSPWAVYMGLPAKESS